MILEQTNALKGQFAQTAGHARSVSFSGIPLTMADPGICKHVVSIRGKDEARRFLTNLGFTEGADVTLISENSGNVIVNVRDTRIAISKSMAARILTD